MQVFLFNDGVIEHKILAEACVNFLQVLEQTFGELKNNLLTTNFVMQILKEFKTIENRNVTTSRTAFVFIAKIL